MPLKTYTYFFLLFLLVLTANTGCKQKNKEHSASQKSAVDSIGVKYYFDTTQYKLHRSGFYVSKSSDIFQLNRVTYDDTAGIWTTYYWLDSLMFYGEYPNRKPLKEVIDLATFVSDTASSYEKDKNRVYFSRATSDGIYRFVVEKADPKTFVSIGQRWGKDKSHIFYESDVVKDADLKSFHVLNDQDSAKDKKQIYYLGKRVKL